MKTASSKSRGGVYADSTVFEVFTLPLLRGTPGTALRAPNSIVLSEHTAHRYFGDTDPMGRTLTVTGWRDLTVTGIMKDLPTTTHLPFDFIVSMSTFYDTAGDWVETARTWAGFYTYVLLKEVHQADVVAQKTPAFANAFFSGWIFLGAGLIALLVAFATVSYQSIKAALADPVDTLRYE